MAIPVGGSHDIVVYEGAGFREEFEVYEDDETTPINFPSGSTGKAQMRTSEKTTASLLADFTVEIIDNKIVIVLSSEEFYSNISSISTKSAYYDIFITEPDQEPVLFMEGKVKINRAVTEPDPVTP